MAGDWSKWAISVVMDYTVPKYSPHPEHFASLRPPIRWRTAVERSVVAVTTACCGLLVVTSVWLSVPTAGGELFRIRRQNLQGLAPWVELFTVTHYAGKLSLHFGWSWYRFPNPQAKSQAIIDTPLDHGPVYSLKSDAYINHAGFPTKIRCIGNWGTGSSLYLATISTAPPFRVPLPPRQGGASESHHEVGLILTARAMWTISLILLVPLLLIARRRQRLPFTRGFPLQVSEN